MQNYLAVEAPSTTSNKYQSEISSGTSAAGAGAIRPFSAAYYQILPHLQ